MCAALFVNAEAVRANFLRDLASNETTAFIPRNIHVVTGRRFRGRGEQCLREFFCLAQTSGKLDAANGLARAILFPSRPREISPDNAFHGQRFGLHDDHRSVRELILEWLELRRELRDVARQHVIWDERAAAEPKGGEKIEDFPLPRNGIRQHAIKCGNAIGRHEQKLLPQIKNLADFSTRDLRDAGQLEADNLHSPRLGI